MGDDSAFGRWYREHLGAPPEPDQVSGYWTFLLGAATALAAVCFFLLSTTHPVDSSPYFLYRQIAFTTALLAGPIVGLSVIYLLPLQERAVTLALVGLVVCALAIAGFNVVYPADWHDGLDYSAPVVTLYAVGVAVQLLTVVVYPLLTDDTAQPAATAVTDRATSEATFQLYEDGSGEHRWRLSRDDGTVLATAGGSYGSREEARQGLESVRVTAPDADETVLEGPPTADASDGTTVDASDRVTAGTTTDEASATSPATGADGTTASTDGDVDTPSDDAADGSVGDVDTADVGGRGVDTADVGGRGVDAMDSDDELPNDGRFELYKDGSGEWRWRFRHRDGDVVADSGQGHSARSAMEDAVGRLKSVASDTDSQEYDPAAFELYTDRSGGWRWRLRHRNGKILADTGEGFSSRGNARRGIDAVRDGATDADRFEVYEDDDGAYRWRLRAENGDVLADGGEGYGLESTARRAVERVREYAPVADTLDYDPAGFELYLDDDGDWRWRLRHRNGNVLADSDQGYSVKAKARQGMRSVVNNAASAEVVERAD